MSKITNLSQTVAAALSQFQDAFFFIIASILFLVSQVMSAPCTLWFFTQLAGVGVAAWFFASVIELAGGYASWELMRRIDENNLPRQAEKRKLPVWLCWLTAGVSIALEGAAIYAYIYAHATPLALATRLGVADVGLYAVLASILALVGAMIVGFHAQRVRLNVREAADGANKPAKPAAQAAQSSEESDKGLQCERLACPYCGTTSGKDGNPFTRMEQVSAHLRWCAAYQAREGEGDEQERA